MPFIEQIKAFVRRLAGGGDETHQIIDNKQIKNRFTPTLIEPDEKPVEWKKSFKKISDES